MESIEEKSKKSKALIFKIEEMTFSSVKQFLLGAQIKELGNIPADARLYLQNRDPWVDNLIDDDEEVDLARPGIEYFFVEKSFQFKLNGNIYSWRQRFITGEQIRDLADLVDDQELFLKTTDADIDRIVGAQDLIDLLLPGIEEFFTVENSKSKTIFVSGAAVTWDKRKISFKEVIMIAYGSYDESPTMIYTVAYENGPRKNPEGSMVKGGQVFTKDQMIFHATATNQS